MANTGSLDRFTPSTRQSIERARASVGRYRHSHITAEHILFGLIEVADPAVLKCLSAGKAGPEQIKALVEHHLRPGDYEIPDEQLSFSERAKRVIEAAREESARAKKPQIAPEHLLLGLTRVRNTVAGAVLAAVDLDTEKVRGVLDTK